MYEELSKYIAARLDAAIDREFAKAQFSYRFPTISAWVESMPNQRSEPGIITITVDSIPADTVLAKWKEEYKAKIDYYGEVDLFRSDKCDVTPRLDYYRGWDVVCSGKCDAGAHVFSVSKECRISQLAQMYAKPKDEFSTSELAAINKAVEQIHQDKKHFALRGDKFKLCDLYWEVCAYVRDNFYARPLIFPNQEAYMRHMLKFWTGGIYIGP